MARLTTKKCNGCGEEKPIEDFYEKMWKGKKYPRSVCKKCHCAKPPYKTKAYYERRRARGRTERTDASKRARFIFKDTKMFDRRNALDNDLTREMIAELISGGCSYCGEASIKMGLDRIHNDRGHLRDNVVPACIRCNDTRGNMPHEAWLLLVPAMRQARESGLFGDWRGRRRI